MTSSPPDPLAALAAARVAYESPALAEEDLAPTPLEQVAQWYDDAVRAGVPEPNAMVLSTADASGAPSVRTVLLKQADARGFVFYTNHGSRKARQIAARPQVALVLPWVTLHRQVAVRGVADRVPRAEVEAYFTSRPWASRVGAWASRQSATVAGRAVLDHRFAELAARWPDRGRPDDVPVPDHWGGYVVRPVEVEFWQGRLSRLHDRLVLLSVTGEPAALDDPAAWRLERRQP